MLMVNIYIIVQNFIMNMVKSIKKKNTCKNYLKIIEMLIPLLNFKATIKLLISKCVNLQKKKIINWFISRLLVGKSDLPAVKIFYGQAKLK